MTGFSMNPESDMTGDPELAVGLSPDQIEGEENDFNL
jgi:hypothetical protein